MEISFRDAHFCVWGSQAQGGTYLLRLTTPASLTVQFGRFQNGRSLPIAPGDYLYVGSALAARGSTSLARRLLRHASRTDPAAPHALRARMLQVFPEIGLGPTPLRPPAGKKLCWHVDYLLEETAVSLQSVYFMRQFTAGLGLETAVAHFLLTLPLVAPLAVGLGSSDDPGGTHLLRIEADADWWFDFPGRLNALLQGVAA